MRDEQQHSEHLKKVPLVQKATNEGWKMWATTHGFSHFNERIVDRLQDMGVDVIRGAQVTKILQDENQSLSVQYEEQGNFLLYLKVFEILNKYLIEFINYKLGFLTFIESFKVTALKVKGPLKKDKLYLTHCIIAPFNLKNEVHTMLPINVHPRIPIFYDILL